MTTYTIKKTDKSSKYYGWYVAKNGAEHVKDIEDAIQSNFIPTLRDYIYEPYQTIVPVEGV